MTTTLLAGEPATFHVDDTEGIDACYRDNGFVVIRGLYPEAELDRLEAECVAAQEGVAAGRLDERYGTATLVDDANPTPFVNYVIHVQEVAPSVLEAASHPRLVEHLHRWLGPDAWLLQEHRFGIVYQDARPGRESAYTRIGWHSDWQSGPDLDVWPSTAFTIHIDATSPANGFLRVVPGSHLWATPAPYRNANGVALPEGSAPTAGYSADPPPFDMPLGFEKIPGEIPVYAERGDVILHDAYTWHSAARATDDATRRRHIRGGWYSGSGPTAEDTVDRFVKNAAR